MNTRLIKSIVIFFAGFFAGVLLFLFKIEEIKENVVRNVVSYELREAGALMGILSQKGEEGIFRLMELRISTISSLVDDEKTSLRKWKYLDDDFFYYTDPITVIEDYLNRAKKLLETYQRNNAPAVPPNL